jgi:hypothetical protein
MSRPAALPLRDVAGGDVESLRSRLAHIHVGDLVEFDAQLTKRLELPSRAASSSGMM